MQTKTNM